MGVRLQKFQVIANPDSKQATINLTMNLSAHFLHYLDKDVEINPLLLNVNDLEALGFRRIL